MLKRIITAWVCLALSALFVADQTSAERRTPTASPLAVKQAVEKSLPLLDKIRLPFMEQTGCVSCHHNSLPALATALARERGFQINENTARTETAQILALWRQGREKLLQGDGFPGHEFTASFTLVGLAANQQTPNEVTDATIVYLLRRQLAEGNWQGLGSGRPPLDSSEIKTTALCIRALQLYAPTGLRQEVQRSVAQARTWLAQVKPQNTDEQSFQLLGLRWAKAEPASLQKMVRTLLGQQLPDGGWGQWPTLASDAYATGQVLVALHQAGGLPITQPAYQRGVNFLLTTQAADGSWLVRTRAYPFQKYFESGFPYGKDQWISAAATSWATMALALTIEVPAQLTQRGQP